MSHLVEWSKRRFSYNYSSSVIFRNSRFWLEVKMWDMRCQFLFIVYLSYINYIFYETLNILCLSFSEIRIYAVILNT